MNTNQGYEKIAVQQSETIVIEGIKFRGEKSKKLKSLMNEQSSQSKMFFRGIMEIFVEKKATQDEWHEFFHSIEEFQEMQGKLYNLFLPSILQVTCHISFPTLKYLDISNNKLVSIQSLPFFNLPCIENIFIDDNPITISKPLNKIHFPQLNTIHIKRQQMQLCQELYEIDSYIKDTTFSRIGTNNQIEYLIFTYKPEFKRGINEDASIFAKLKAQKVKKITFESVQAIKQEKVYQSIKRKYLGIQLFAHPKNYAFN